MPGLTLFLLLVYRYAGALEVSIFDDGSSDGTKQLISSWAERLRACGIDAITSGSRWGSHTAGGHATPTVNTAGGEVASDAPPGGIGFAKNQVSPG